MALSDAALTLVTTVETELGLVAGAETRLEGWIEDASEMIASYLGRTLHRSDAIVEKVAGDGSQWLQVSRPPLLSVGSISHFSSTVGTGSYEIHDAAGGAIFFLGGTTNDDQMLGGGVSQDAIVGTERKLYTVTYAGGFVTPRQSEAGALLGQTVTLPRAIRRACIELVAFLMSRAGQDAGIKSEAMLSYSVTYADDDADDDGSGIPKRIRAKILGYKLDRL